MAACHHWFDLNTKDEYGMNIVLWAVSQGQIEILRELIKPKDQGGFGLTLAVTDKDGNFPVSCAIAHGQTAMLKELTLEKDKGGFGLVLNVKNSGQFLKQEVMANGNHALIENTDVDSCRVMDDRQDKKCNFSPRLQLADKQPPYSRPMPDCSDKQYGKKL